MTPETFNAALATRKLEAIDILLIQAKRGSDADRIRAASAILRIAFFPLPSASSRCAAKPPLPQQAQCLQVSIRRQSDESSRSGAAGEAGATPSSGSLPVSNGEGWGGERLPNAAASLQALAGAAPPTPSHSASSSSFPSTPSTPINFTTPPHTQARPLPMDPSHHRTFPPRGLILNPDPAHPLPPQTLTSLATPIIHYEHQHQFSSA